MKKYLYKIYFIHFILLISSSLIAAELNPLKESCELVGGYHEYLEAIEQNRELNNNSPFINAAYLYKSEFEGVKANQTATDELPNIVELLKTEALNFDKLYDKFFFSEDNIEKIVNANPSNADLSISNSCQLYKKIIYNANFDIINNLIKYSLSTTSQNSKLLYEARIKSVISRITPLFELFYFEKEASITKEASGFIETENPCIQNMSNRTDLIDKLRTLESAYLKLPILIFGKDSYANAYRLPLKLSKMAIKDTEPVKNISTEILLSLPLLPLPYSMAMRLGTNLILLRKVAMYGILPNSLFKSSELIFDYMFNPEDKINAKTRTSVLIYEQLKAILELPLQSPGRYANMLNLEIKADKENFDKLYLRQLSKAGKLKLIYSEEQNPSKYEDVDKPFEVRYEFCRANNFFRP